MTPVRIMAVRSRSFTCPIQRERFGNVSGRFKTLPGRFYMRDVLKGVRGGVGASRRQRWTRAMETATPLVDALAGLTSEFTGWHI